jgi:GNAT superfamily N-acetyltransferase
MKMRCAISEDVPAILALLADDDLEKLTHTEATAEVMAAFAAIDADPNQMLAVAGDDGKIAGCIQLTFIPGLSRNGMWRCHIEAVRIARPLRGKGLGARMLSWAQNEARTRHCGMMQLLVDKSRSNAHRFYESQGLQASHYGFRHYF